jgi:hypothetical protein
VQFRELLDQRKPDPKTAAIAPAAAIGLTEHFEDTRQEVGIDTLPRIRHLDTHKPVFPRQRHSHASAVRRELQRIANRKQ